jgi:hypothetical protein
VLTVIVTIMKITGGGGGGYICNANSYCGNKGEVYMQSEQLL